MSLKLLKEQLRKAKIIKKGDYKYIVNAICEQEPVLEPAIFGGTILAMIEGVKNVGAEIEDVGAIFNKIDYGGMRDLKRKGFSPKVLLDVKLNGDRVEVRDV